MDLSQQEYAALGPGFVRLSETPENEWARKAVLRMRGIDDETGEQRVTPRAPAGKLPPAMSASAQSVLSNITTHMHVHDPK